MATLASGTSAAGVCAALCSTIVLSPTGFFVESSASSVTLGFAWLVLLGRWYVFDIILRKLIEIGWTEFYEYADILLNVATHLLLRILN